MLDKIFQDIQDFKKYVGGGANMSLQMSSIAPTMHDAARDHLVPYLGGEFWGALNGELPLNTRIPPTVLRYIKRPLALLTMYEYSKIAGVQASELGLMRVQTDSHQSAFRYQETEYRAYMLEKGYEALDELLVFLMTNRADYDWWRESAGFYKHTELFVRYASQLRSHYGMNISRYTYEILRGVLRDVEYFVIESFLPIAFVEHLRGLNETGSPTPEEVQAIVMVQAACVHLAIQEGLKRECVQFKGRSVVQLELDNTQSNTNEKTASQDGLTMKLLHHEISANRHLQRLTAYIRRNADAFPLVFTGVDAWQTQVIENQTIAQDTKTKTILLL
jgi:hypothetical protein